MSYIIFIFHLNMNQEKQLSLNSLNNSESIKPHKKKIKSKSKFSIKKIKNDNTLFLNFTINSSFIFQPKLSKYTYQNFSDINVIKPTDNELDYINNLIKELDNPSSINDNIYYVTPLFSLIMNNTKKVEPIKDKKSLIIQNIIKDNAKKGHISIRKITQEFNKICTKEEVSKISKTHVHRIIKNVLKYKYRKTTLKNTKLLENYSIKNSYFFLKIFLRAVSLNIQPIYLDEAGFFTKNSNFYTWRQENEEIFTKIEDRKKINLIMAVSPQKIIYYDLTESNTDNNTFKNFMEGLVNNMQNEEIQNHIIILDNLSSHLTNDLFEFYKNKNLKVLFNIPYNSPWNMIELVFRLIKNITYKRIYNNINSLKADVIEIIKSGKIEASLPRLYKETINQYINFIKINNYIDLNN